MELELVQKALAHNTAFNMRNSISDASFSHSSINELRKSYLQVAIVSNNDSQNQSFSAHSRRGTSRGMRKMGTIVNTLAAEDVPDIQLLQDEDQDPDMPLEMLFQNHFLNQ